MQYKVSDIAQIISANPLQITADIKVEHLIYDSRRVWFPESSIFFSLPGKKRKGIDFIPELYEKGVRVFVVNELDAKKIFDKFSDASFLPVADVLYALQKLASYHRNQFRIPIIGITGSNGKTIVKEWLSQSLQNTRQIVKSPGSFNSQLGVPMSVWQLNEKHSLGIFEAGISKPGEMLRLEQMIHPSIGILTFMGEAHSEGFDHYRQKITEKLILFNHASQVIYCSDDETVQSAIISWSKSHPQAKLYAWGRNENATYKVVNEEKIGTHTKLTATCQEKIIEINVPFSDNASLHNSMSCIVCMLAFGMNEVDIQKAAQSWKPVSMRLEQRLAIHQCTLINDSYSSDLSSLRSGLDFLHQQTAHAKHSLILTDMEETGMKPEVWIANIKELLSQYSIHRFIGLGPILTAHQDAFVQITETNFYSDTETLLRQLPFISFFNEAILLKGSRSFMLERAVRMLEQKKHDTVLEINLNALRHNLSVYRKLLPTHVKLMVMVKAFGYGTGGHEIANLLKQEGVDYLAVAFADEGVELRMAGVHSPIMVLNPHPDTFDQLIEHQLEPEIYSFNILQAFHSFLEVKKIEQFPVHIKLDTGMHRLGFMESDMDLLCDRLKQNKRLKIASVLSHLAASEDPQSDSFTKTQRDLFERMSANLKNAVKYPFIKHLSNTSAIRRHSDCQFDMVRLGIGLYGVDVDLPLQNVATLKTTIAQIKKLSKGETVGYGRAGVLERDSFIATIRIGYADGYPRILSNGNGSMLVNGKQAPVIGNVCMDMTMLDMTDIQAQEGDEVIVFGAALPITQVAESAQTIPYEILTGIAQRVNRVYIQD